MRRPHRSDSRRPKQPGQEADRLQAVETGEHRVTDAVAIAQRWDERGQTVDRPGGGEEYGEDGQQSGASLRMGH